MKRLFISLIFIILSLPLFAFTLQGGITYTVNSARLESFNDVKYKIDVSKYSQFLNDSNFMENKKLLSRNK